MMMTVDDAHDLDHQSTTMTVNIWLTLSKFSSSTNIRDAHQRSACTSAAASGASATKTRPPQSAQDIDEKGQ
eukprot:9160441-Karenia_brevis.AAC.1